MTSIRKIDWESGVAEALSFAFLFPIFVWLILMLVGLSDLAVVKQRIEYINYSCARAAATASTLHIAQKRSMDLYTMNFSINNYVTIENLDDTPTIIEVSSVRKDKDRDEWIEGNFITHTSRAYYKNITPFMQDTIVQAGMVMMIEFSVGGN